MENFEAAIIANRLAKDVFNLDDPIQVRLSNLTPKVVQSLSNDDLMIVLNHMNFNDYKLIAGFWTKDKMFFLKETVK